MIRRRNAHEGDSPTVMWWVRDWLTSEAVLSMPRAARSLYFDLLLHQWINGSLPADTKVLASLTGEAHTAFLKLWRHCASCFDKGEDGRLRNPRMETERQADEEYRKRRSAAGQSGNDKRWEEHRKLIANGSDCDNSATDLGVGERSPSSSSSLSSPSENPPTPRKRGKRAARAVASPDPPWSEHHTLDTPAVRVAWTAWEAHRREIKHPLTSETVRATFKRYAGRPGPFLAAIEHTIRMGWQGLRDPDPEDVARASPAQSNGKFETTDEADVRSRWMRRHTRKIPNPTGMPGTVEVTDPYPGLTAARAELEARTA